MGEIDTILDHGAGIDDGAGIHEDDQVPPIDTAATPVTRPGDLWVLDDHHILCGDALSNKSYAGLLGNDKADMVFATIPTTAGNLSGFGAVEQADLSMAGKPFSAGLVSLLQTSLGHAASYSVGGALHFVCMDWPHTKELITAGERIYSEWKDLCVWTNSNTGTGSIYEAGHELIFVFKVGTAPHVNNVSRGRVSPEPNELWNYGTPIAVNSTSKSKVTLTAIKPVAMIADAIRDCCNRGGLILDPFGGVGTTLIAAERTGRRARLIERDPMLVDLSIERWQRLTGGAARHADNGELFERSEQHRGPKSIGPENQIQKVSINGHAQTYRHNSPRCRHLYRRVPQTTEAHPIPTRSVGQPGRGPQRRAQFQELTWFVPSSCRSR